MLCYNQLISREQFMTKSDYANANVLRNSYDFRVALPIIVITLFCFGFVMSSPFKPNAQRDELSASHGSSNLNASASSSQSFKVSYPTLQHLSPAPVSNNASNSSELDSLAEMSGQTQVQTTSPQTATGSSESSSSQYSLPSLQKAVGPVISQPVRNLSNNAKSSANDHLNKLLVHTQGLVTNLSNL